MRCKRKKNVKKNKKPMEMTRKEIRKEKRKQKKVSRALYYEEKKKKLPGKFASSPERRSDVRTESTSKGEHFFNTEDPKDELQKKVDRERKKVAKVAKDTESRRKKDLEEANRKEERIIERLEKRLKLNKRKRKSMPESFAADGLDYLLDFCNDENRALAVEAEKQLLRGDADSDFEEDFAMITGSKEDTLTFNTANSLDEVTSEEEESPGKKSKSGKELESPEGKKVKKYEKTKKKSHREVPINIVEKFSENSIDEIEDENFSDLHKSEDGGDDFDSLENTPVRSDVNEANKDDDDDDSLSDSEDDTNKWNKVDDTWEDIYGRKRDKEGNIVNNDDKKYIPPGARLKQLENDSASSEKLSRLRKQLKGYLNRLAEHNMHTIAAQIEELYMANSRNDMNEMLSKLMMESIVSPVITPDRLIAEHMMLVAILHANVGTEVGAHFLLFLVRRLDETMKSSRDVEKKELDNIVLMISHLYNFKVYGSRLLYQILGKLAERFAEKEIELILLVLKSVGFLLRKDDPVALKELILNLQQKALATTAAAAAAAASNSNKSRINFMLDVLMAIKNNNMSKIPQYDPTHVEHLKKIIKTFVRKGNAVTQFDISLEDLLRVKERGKWWVVGSAWTGNNDPTKPLKTSDGAEEPLFSQKILDLARKQRMNTDTRRNIFCILMTAEDYTDAFEKLQHLALKDQQAREILYVIMDCCLQEKHFNPYYAVLAQKFCDYDRKNQMTLRYSLWDKFKALENLNDKQLTNLAKFLTHLFVEKGLALSVLKVIEFGKLDRRTMRLLRRIILGILLHESTEACVHVFERISVSPRLKTFREGLRLFVNHFLVKNAESRLSFVKDIEKLKSRAESVDKILATRAGRVAF